MPEPRHSDRAPKIYQVPFPLADFTEERAAGLRALGFDWVALELPDGPDEAEAALRRMAELCRAQGLKLLLDVTLARLDVEDEYLAAGCATRLKGLLRAGATGFCFRAPGEAPPETWQEILAEVRQDSPQCRFFAWTPGTSWRRSAALAPIGLDGVFSSVAWWDGRASWLVEEYEVLRGVAPVLGSVELPAAKPFTLRAAAATGQGLLLSGPLEGQDGALRAAQALTDRLSELGMHGQLRALTGPGSPVTALLRADHADVRRAERAAVVLINPDPGQERAPALGLAPLAAAAGAAFDKPILLEGGNDPAAPLQPGEVRVLLVERTRPVAPRGPAAAESLARALRQPRVVIERLSPAVDDGRYPAKCVVGDSVVVEADIFADGHEVLAAELLWKAADEAEWQRAPLRQRVNDRWQGSFAPARLGRHLFTIEAWIDSYGSFCRDLDKKLTAGQEVELELLEGRALIEAAAARASEPLASTLTALLRQVEQAEPPARSGILLAQETRGAMAAADERAFRTRNEPPLPLEVDRPQAVFAAWYELFPRSVTDSPVRHGTFDDVIARLPAIRDMGFDVLYFPPIHPIGLTNRKGRNNSLRAESGDLGSPYAIGGQEGGHDAVHPALGGIEAFRRLRDAAAEQGMEIALDFAIQCSPDHPWLKQHPAWFSWRPDGSLRFAENPPKKYEDIVNVDFYAEGAQPGLWLALRDVVLYWVGEGVRTFRVDNPHTKPLPFWEWLIASVKAEHPDVIFLSEAFTRPKMMYRLAKIGFSQSYTYFTWRNGKQELTDYLTELTTSAARDFFRPHFFVNTPDINPYFLQSSGRPGFLIRAALAATLSGLWGLYSGFELCEAAPLPGREEYLDSEKYEIRVRDYDAPGNIKAEIAALNRIRKANPALQSHLNLTFYNAYNDQVLLYGKTLPTREEMILVAVSLDPHHAQEAIFEAPLWEWNLPDHASLAVEDLMRGHGGVWTGKLQRLRLDPALPFAIWRLRPLGRPGA